MLLDSLVGSWFFMLVLMPAPLWLPAVFFAYAIGRKRFGVWLALWLIAAECVSLVAIAAVMSTVKW